MMRLLLPTPIGRSRLRAFWCQVSALLGLVTGMLLVGLFAVSTPTAWGVAALVALVVAVPGLARPYGVQWAYRGWNVAARRGAALVERYVTFVCFATVLVASSIGSPARTFERAPVRGSMWFSRGTQAGATYPSQHHVAGPSVSSRAWTADYRAWARSSGHTAAVALIPFLALLRAVADDRADAPTSSNIYTLY